MSKKRKITLSIISALLIICTIISMSYAFYTLSVNNEMELSTSVNIPSCASVTLSGGTKINLTGDKAAPISDKKALGSTDYRYSFTVANGCDTASNLKVALAPSVESTMPMGAIKYVIIDSSASVPSTGNYLSVSGTEKILSNQIIEEVYKSDSITVERGYEILNVSLSANSTKTYYLYLWIDEYEGDMSGSGKNNNITMDKTLSASLIVSDFSAEEGGNPTLSGTVLGTVSEYDYASSQDSTPYRVVDQNGVRYEGADPDNYVTYNGETWRIIGTFDGKDIGLEAGKKYTKIIRSNPFNAITPWDMDWENDWTEAELNTMLNTDYLNQTGDFIITATDKGLSAVAREMIAKYNGNYSKWYLGGIGSTYNTDSSDGYYTQERGTTGYNGTIDSAKLSTNAAIGLMYPSDYGYAMYGGASETTCINTTTALQIYENCVQYHWLYLSDKPQWTITPSSSNYYSAFSVYSSGYVSGNQASTYSGYTVRPTLYLEADVQVTSGDGSKESPYRLYKQMSLSDTVLAQVSNEDYTSSQDSTPYRVIDQEAKIPDDSASYAQLTQSQYGTTSEYKGSSYTSTSGTDSTTELYFDWQSDNTWTNDTTNMATSSYYHLKIPVTEEGAYQICYKVTTSASSNYLRAYITDSSFSSSGTQMLSKVLSSTSSTFTCTDLGTLITSQGIRIVNRTYTSKAAVTFYLQKKPVKSVSTGIRYEGANPDNYVTYNGEEWRIIGTFDGSDIGLESGKKYTKIIRNSPFNTLYSWDDDLGDWTEATLNIMLNSDYLNQAGDFVSTATDKGLSPEAREMIAQYNGNYSKWYLGGVGDTYNTDSSDGYYILERGTTGYNNTTDATKLSTNAAIGLMYPSDYGYAMYGGTSETTCINTTTKLYSGGYNYCEQFDWLWLSDNAQSTITPDSCDSGNAFSVRSTGFVSHYFVNDAYGVRPVLYLESDVRVVGGNGSKGSAYKLK